MSAPYQVMPEMTPDEFEALKSDIALRGVLVPIEKDEKGNVLDGHHRLRACEELGYTDYPVIFRIGLSETEKRAHARTLNFSRRQVTQGQKRDGIASQLRETPEKSNREIGRIIGVDHKTVADVRAKMVAGGEIPHLAYTVGKDGKRYLLDHAEASSQQVPTHDPVFMMHEYGEITCVNIPERFLLVLSPAEDLKSFKVAMVDFEVGQVTTCGNPTDRGLPLDIDAEQVRDNIIRTAALFAIDTFPEGFNYQPAMAKATSDFPDYLDWRPTAGGLYHRIKQSMGDCVGGAR